MVMLRSRSRAIFIASLMALIAERAALANGPMGGGGSGKPPPGQGGYVQPFIPDVPIPSRGDSGSGPSPEQIPYGYGPPPGGESQSDRMINQINQLGKISQERDRMRRKCHNLRTDIASLQAEGSTETAIAQGDAAADQVRFDRYAQMSPKQLDDEILAGRLMNGGLPGTEKDNYYRERIAQLREIKALRERYGTGTVYQNALRDTALYQSIRDRKEQAALNQRDHDQPALRDLKAEYADLGCDTIDASR